jgi:hypothetical protein
VTERRFACWIKLHRIEFNEHSSPYIREGGSAMTKQLTPLMTAVILGCGVVGASAQQGPGTPQPPAQAQQQPSFGPGMMGRGMGMGYGMGRGMMGPSGMGSPLFMRMMFALMDTDADGTVSLQEFQAAHERIFKAMDANKDGVLTLEEIQAFMRGTGTPAGQPSSAPTPQRP